jgi:hypothetical protein
MGSINEGHLGLYHFVGTSYESSRILEPAPYKRSKEGNKPSSISNNSEFT